jgi:Ca2+-binding RTX toxin-like protein
MATMTFYTASNMNAPIEGGTFALVYNAGTELVLTDGAYNIGITGTGLTYDAATDSMTGTASGISFSDAVWGSPIYTLSGASINLSLNYYDNGYDTNADGKNDVWGMQADQAYWLRSNDTINGSSGADVLNGYLGADKIYGNAGDDILTGGQGNDTLDGGAGSDYVNYNDLRTVTNAAAAVTYKFVSTGNLGSGTVAISEVVAGVTTPTQTDTVANIELFRGTKAADLINFASSTGYQDAFQGFTGNDTIIGGDTLSATAWTSTINDTDIVDYRYLGAPSLRVKVDLTNTDSTTLYATALTYFNSSIPGETDSLRKIHGVIGGAGNDTVIGSAADDSFRGQGGNDSFVGGAGSDWIDYNYNPTALNITLAAGGAQQTINAGSFGGTDTISGVENIAASGNNDFLKGNEFSNLLRGRGGNDTINGGDGNEIDYVDYKNATGSVTVTWSTSANTATSSGADGVDTIINMEGVRGSIGFNDTFVAGLYSSYFDGRGGVDTLSFAQFATAKSINLGLTSPQSGYTVLSIENLTGSSAGDSFTGNAVANVLNGAAGNDNLSGGAGNDTLIGGAGKDGLAGGLGNDVFDFNSLTELGLGSAARDVISDWNAGDRIDLSTIDWDATTTGNQAFTYLGSAVFTTTAGQVRYSGGVLQINTDTDTAAEYEIQITGTYPASLTVGTDILL